MRIVTLFPAATEIVAALGAGEALVGVSHECDYPPQVRGLPRVTRSAVDASWPSGQIDRAVAAAARAGTPPIAIDRDVLARLAPDVLIGQAVCDVCAVGMGDVAGALAALPVRPLVVTLHAHDLSGVWADIGRVGEALDLAPEAEEVIAGLQYRLRRIASHVPTSPRPRILVVEWVDPPYVAGHWVPELVAAAGGVDVAARPGDRSVTLPWRELRARAPDVVIVALCGFDETRARREVAAVADPDGRALLGGTVGFLDGNAYTSRPGPRLVEGAEALARILETI